jgi:hypothetical protein
VGLGRLVGGGEEFAGVAGLRHGDLQGVRDINQRFEAQKQTTLVSVRFGGLEILGGVGGDTKGYRRRSCLCPCAEGGLTASLRHIAGGLGMPAQSFPCLVLNMGKKVLATGVLEYLFLFD